MRFELATAALAIISGASAIALQSRCDRVQDNQLQVVAYGGGNGTAFCVTWKSTWYVSTSSGQVPPRTQSLVAPSYLFCSAAYQPTNTSLVFYSSACSLGNLHFTNQSEEVRRRPSCPS
jgi:hypothetical protein